MNNSHQNIAVVLGTDVNGLGHIRSLGSNGIRVYGVYSEKSDESLGRYSRYCIPVSCKRDNNFEILLNEKLISLAENMPEKPVLFATSDYYVDFISRFRGELEKVYLFNIPDEKILNTISNKKLINSAAEKAGIHTPKTYTISSETLLKSISKSVQYPCIIKPKDSYSVNFPGKNFIAEKSNDLERFYNINQELEENTLIQEIIAGSESNIYQCTGYFNKGSKPLQLFTMQKLHQFPPNFGITTFGRSLIKADLMEITEKFLTAIGYTGFASVEYKWNNARGKYYLIEVNPRLPWYNGLFTSSNVNLPYIYYQDMKCTDEGGEFNSFMQKENFYWMYFRNELAGYWKRKQAGKKDNLCKLIKALANTRSFAYWDKADPIPFVMANFEFFKWGASKIFKKDAKNVD